MTSSPYPIGTILARTAPEDDPYDRVRIAGLSTSKAAMLSEEWAGSSGEALAVEPADEFGRPQTVTVPQLQAEYEVEAYPEGDEARFTLGGSNAPNEREPTPEEVFKRREREAPADGPADA